MRTGPGRLDVAPSMPNMAGFASMNASSKVRPQGPPSASGRWKAMRRRFSTFAASSLARRAAGEQSPSPNQDFRQALLVAVPWCTGHVGTIGGDGVEVGDDEGAQFQEIEKSEEDVRVGAADFRRRHVLAGEVGLGGFGVLQLVR